MRVARFRDGSWVPRRMQGWPEKNGSDERKRKRGFWEVRERGDREEKESPKKNLKVFLSPGFCPNLKIIQLIIFPCNYFSFTKF